MNLYRAKGSCRRRILFSMAHNEPSHILFNFWAILMPSLPGTQLLLNLALYSQALLKLRKTHAYRGFRLRPSQLRTPPDTSQQQPFMYCLLRSGSTLQPSYPLSTSRNSSLSQTSSGDASTFTRSPICWISTRCRSATAVNGGDFDHS